MSKRKEIIEQAGIYTFSSQIAQFITLMAAVLSRRFLGPTQMGIWATLQIIVEYSRYSTLGMLHGVAREIPYYMAKGKIETAEEIKNVVFTSILAGSSIMACAIFLFALMTRGKFAPEVSYGLFFVSAIIVLQRINDLLIGLLRCYKKFTLASTQMIWSAVVNAALVALLTYFFKIYGFIWAIGLSFIFNIFYIGWYHPFHFRFQFHGERFRSLVKFGFPLLLIGIMTTVLRSIDKILVVKFLGFEALGFYSIAFMASTYIGSFSNSIAIVSIPHFQEKFSVSDNPADLKEFVAKAADAYALVSSGIIGLIWVVAPYFVALFLPKFTPGIPAMKMLSLGMFFLSLVQPYSDTLITIKKHVHLFPLLGVTSVLALLLNSSVIAAGYGITGVASASSAAAFFNFLITYFFASRYLEDRFHALRRFFVFLGRGAYLGLTLILINQWVSPDIYSLQKTVAQFSLFIAFYAPFLWVFNSRFSLLSLLRERISTKKKYAAES